ncbi:MAG: hypothetical protein PHY02_01445 [Phycisphaerae bacterium]|nr:hypothetical protein [Phycisphaerae bacterium]
MAKIDRERFIKPYKEIWKRLGKKENEKIKILWCYTDEKYAKEQKSSFDYKNKVLWKLDVPEENIRYICSIAWNWILFGRSGCTYPSRFEHFYRALYNASNNPSLKYEFYEAFDSGWQMVKEKGTLWDTLFFPNGLVEECTTAIVIHPVEQTWFKESFGFDEV